MTTNNNIYDELARLERERDKYRNGIEAALDSNEATKVLKFRISGLNDELAAVKAERDALAAQIAGLREKVESIKRGLCYWLPLDPWERVCVDLDALVTTAPKSKDE